MSYGNAEDKIGTRKSSSIFRSLVGQGQSCYYNTHQCTILLESLGKARRFAIVTFRSTQGVTRRMVLIGGKYKRRGH